MKLPFIVGSEAILKALPRPEPIYEPAKVAFSPQLDELEAFGLVVLTVINNRLHAKQSWEGDSYLRRLGAERERLRHQVAVLYGQEISEIATRR